MGTIGLLFIIPLYCAYVELCEFIKIQTILIVHASLKELLDINVYAILQSCEFLLVT